MYIVNHQYLHEFAESNHLSGLSETSVKAIMEGFHDYSVAKGEKFLAFQQRINHELLQHRVITDNRYTRWFEHGAQTEAQMKAFIIQFSVFSNQFLVAQLQKIINADSLENMRASKEILANEIGVVFSTLKEMDNAGDKQSDIDSELVSTEGTIEGGIFHFRAAHFEWLLHIANALGLAFNDVGKRQQGTASTLFFCDELIRLYGGSDYMISQAASFAVENWAAAGFWKALIEGIRQYNRRMGTHLPLAFFSWHDRIEDQHAKHTQEELEAYYFHHQIDENRFIQFGNEMLDGVAAFWNGLDQQRKHMDAH